MLVPLDDRSHLFITKMEVRYLRSSVWQVASVKQMCQSRMFDGQDAAKEMWRHAKNVSSQGTGNVFSTEKKAEVMGAEYAVLECFANRMVF